MTSDEIRETFLEFFAARDHLRIPSAPLVPAEFDPSTLFIVAGMHPLKPYFLGQEQPPHPRLADCQKVFRTPDIAEVGITARHLTFFEMLGNFAIGDYFKQRAVEQAWELSLEGFGLERERIWITVFEGDEALGIGPDEEAISAWESVGVPRERILALPRSENFWQAGPTGPCGPCSELYYDRGSDFGSDDERPGGEGERFLEYWNLVFMQYDQSADGVLTPLPAQNIDTGLGLNRLAAILQDAPSVYETDQFRPLVELGEELSGRSYGEDFATTRALRILADHSRGMNFLIADGVVPSNEDRGYVLRRIMRRAILQGRRIGLEPGFLGLYAARVREIMGSAYPELAEQRAPIEKWLAAEEEGFGHTLEQGTKLLSELIARAQEGGAEGIASEDAFRLHDTFGFPFELTLELVAEEGLGVDEEGFEALMQDQRARARAGGPRVVHGVDREQLFEFAGAAGFVTEFTGYETTETQTTVGALDGADAAAGGRALVKLVESPFYPAGGGQVSDSGTVRCAGGGCTARVEEVFRIGDDQAVALTVEEGAIEPGARVIATVDRPARHATEANHTATHLLHAALRARLGEHVRQAGSYVGPDKLRFDFTHGSALSAEEVADVEQSVNDWIAANHPVRALTTTLDEARSLGAMALFGEKYGDVVRMVEVGDGSFSRELCGGTHVRSSAEIGVFRITAETSSAANVRRIEALTGPGAIDLLRRHDAALREVADRLRTTPEGAVDALESRERERRELVKASRGGGARGGGARGGGVDVEELLARAAERDGARVLVESISAPDEKALLATLDQVKPKLGDAAVLLGSVVDPPSGGRGGRVLFVASVAPALVERGVKAGTIVKAAAEVAGGGGGGRDTMARAGGRDPDKLPAALEAARAAIDAALA